MKEVEFKVETYIKYPKCEKCESNMHYTGVCFTTLPAKNEYKCVECGFIETSCVNYPVTEYREVK